ncbi:transmembrane protein (fibronectin III domain and Gp5 C-terminal repeat) [Legionella steigerwaltii]|uniref:Transmembrane protein (Fibronectin III domain and Gp5 C-terminal repeat) n=1 Tax=Legionella steigerwaltii TaxID=460 RepID=A0A378L7C5_9GAMM|nr:hypothetical protein [Legionella steigerwaltii]KTD77380.1 hypothetical protein Lstg_1737 [Legionella steigerwaltii]STY22260.1 transmembrane protein (fibronectin III domain and Gp5 C-terminal repeat) [Legionella steigerwaltii]
MKLARLMSQIGLGLTTFCLIAATHADIPLWSFSPDTGFPPQLKVSSIGTATVKYKITNNSKKAHQLVIKSITGINQAEPCLVGPKGKGNDTCSLTLTVEGSALSTNGLSGGPSLCQANPDGTPNLNQCYQPGKEDSLSITLIKIKSPINGLINMGDISFYNNPHILPVNDPSIIEPYGASFTAMVINVTWEQLQPNGPGSLVENNAIDQALEAIQSYNQAHPKTLLTAKLRVWGGFTAPLWAKAINGGPISIDATNNGKHQQGTIGLFWTTEYISAWRNLQSLLAARYNSNPLISEVAITSCASETDEPFVSWLDSPTISNLQSFGYTDAQQEACLSGAIDDYIAWTNTMVDYTFSLFHETDGGKIQQDPAFTIQVMQQCQASFKCILSNHALNSPLPSADSFVYAEIQNLYSINPKTTFVDFQTASPMSPLNWCSAIVNGTTYHARSIELWPDFGGFTTLSSNAVANLADAFKNGTPPNPALCP